METSVNKTFDKGFSNNMGKLINKIETRLGLKVLQLPEAIAKNSWPENVILPDTLETFSRYFPQVIDYDIDRLHPKKDGFYYIDEDFIENASIIGVGDIAWPKFTNSSLYYQQELGYGTIDYMSQTAGLNFEDIAMIQMRADMGSIINNKIFVEFTPPSRVAIRGRNNQDLRNLNKFCIKVYIKHDPTLVTIPATKMETFEDLAIADVAGFVYKELKYFDGVETVHASIDLKLNDLEQAYSRREEIIQTLKESFVSASNPAVPIIMCI